MLMVLAGNLIKLMSRIIVQLHTKKLPELAPDFRLPAMAK